MSRFCQFYTDACLLGHAVLMPSSTQAQASGKPAGVIDKMVEGRLVKYFEECVLLDQHYILDEGLRVKDVISKLSKQVGLDLKLHSFLRVQCGEGLD